MRELFLFLVRERRAADSDANGNLTRMSLLAGTGFAGSGGGGEALVVTTTHADGGVMTNAYDVHGDAREVTDQLGRVSEQTFDNMGRLTERHALRGTGSADDLIDTYTYDLTGNRLTHENNVYGAANLEIMDYDALGRVIETRAFGGDVTTTTYAWDDTIATALGTFGGWTETTSVEADRASTTDDIVAAVKTADVFGKAVSRSDLGGQQYTYTYDIAGRLTSETSTNALGGAKKDNSYTYYNTGQVKQHIVGQAPVVDANWNNKTADYEYDALGRLTAEKVENQSGRATSPWDWSAMDAAYQAWLDSQNGGNGEPGEGPSGPPPIGGGGGPPGEGGAGGGLGGGPYDYVFDQYSLPELKDQWLNAQEGDPDAQLFVSLHAPFYTALAPTAVPIVYTTSTEILQDGHAEYDALGRMTRYYDDAVSGAHNVDKTWAYDANGNVRSIDTTYRPMGLNGTQSSTTQTQELWYRYDAMNRMVVADGIRSGSTIVRGTSGTDIAYTVTGQRATAQSGTGAQEAYAYDAGDRMTAVTIGGVTRATSSFDALGRITGHAEYDASGTLVHERHSLVYSARGQVIAEKSKTRQDDGAGGSDWLYAHTVNHYSADGTGGTPSAITGSGSVGSSTGSQLYYSETKNWLNGSASPVYGSSADSDYADAYTSYEYDWRDGAQQYRIGLVNRDGTANTFYHYDRNDHLVLVGTGGGYNSHTKYYETGMNGEILQREEVSVNFATTPATRSYFFGGKRMGEISSDGTHNVDYAEAIERRTSERPDDPGPFRGGATAGEVHADFGLAYNAVNAETHQAGSGQYRARGGETLGQVAQAVWGDSSLWYKLAEANGIGANTALSAGRTIRVPAGVMRNTHNAASLQPYDPARSIGDTQPGTPQPPKNGKNCGVIGAILLAVVAVAVSVIAPIGGTGIAAAIGNAALGSVASQGVGLATGIQDKFSFKGLAISALSAGIAKGIGGKLDVFSGAARGSFKAAANAGITGAAASALTQGIATATGLQAKFSFAGVAAAGVGAAAGFGVGSQLGSSFGAQVAAHTASAIANAATRSALNGSSFGDNLRAAIPDVIGQAVGGVLGRAIHDPSVAARKAVEARPAIATGGGGGGVLALASAIGGALPDPRLAIPEGDYDLVGPATTIEEALDRAKAWEAVKNDPAYSAVAQQNADFYRSLAGNIASANAGPITISATDDLASYDLDAITGFELTSPALDGVARFDASAVQHGTIKAADISLGGGYAANLFYLQNPASVQIEQGSRQFSSGSYLSGAGNIALGNLNYYGAYLTGGFATATSLAREGTAYANPRDLADGVFLEAAIGGVSSMRTTARRTASITTAHTVSDAEFVGPLIGRSGFRTTSELADAIGTRYQGFVDDAYVAAQRVEARDLLRGNRNTRVGAEVDRLSSARLKDYLRSEGIPEGPNGLVQINRWLRDPAGSGAYVRPDVRVPGAGRIFDATVGTKSYNSTQITGFRSYSGGDRITIVRPQAFGSYSFYP